MELVCCIPVPKTVPCTKQTLSLSRKEQQSLASLFFSILTNLYNVITLRKQVRELKSLVYSFTSLDKKLYVQRTENCYSASELFCEVIIKVSISGEKEPLSRKVSG